MAADPARSSPSPKERTHLPWFRLKDLAGREEPASAAAIIQDYREGRPEGLVGSTGNRGVLIALSIRGQAKAMKTVTAEVGLGPMPVPRAELKLVRLLSCCEAMAADKRNPDEWRLEKSSSSEKALANQFLAPGRTPTTAKERTPATKTVHLQTKARFMGEMRNELLDLEEKNLRKRMTPVPDEKQSAAELDAVLQHHHTIQEKLAEEMLHLARNLKNNTLVAQNVIKQDNQTLTQSLKLADQNFEKLKNESDRLEQHAKKSVNWLLWLMLIIVCFIFISMILFIRIFPKLR
ncbi:putative Unconventional SNARE in the ER 1 protein [Naja naja]|nr:putative Unconventional SNARE in the ER 1 protein [Naja naja]